MRVINFDHVAAAPVLPEVVDVMLPYLTEKYGNPSSIHSLGEEVEESIDEAREKIGALINGKPSSITFTSSPRCAASISASRSSLARLSE